MRLSEKFIVARVERNIPRRRKEKQRRIDASLLLRSSMPRMSGRPMASRIGEGSARAVNRVKMVVEEV